MYDMFFVGNFSDNLEYKKLKQKYPFIKVADTLNQAKKKSLTKFFWVVWDNLTVLDEFVFDYIPDQWSQTYVHVFKNKNYNDGIILVPKDSAITDREISHRFFVNKKDIDVQASIPTPFDRFSITSYSDYLKALEQSTTNMFWAVWNDVDVNLDFHFDFQVPFYDQHITHVFKNGEYFDGVCLFSKKNKVSEREFNNRFFITKKEIDIVASTPKEAMFDIVFISYYEPNADKNYELLKQKYPRAKRVDKIKGIHQAHIQAAELSETDLFWVVDGDAVIVEDFKFDYIPPYYDRDSVFVWRSQNPVNKLIYGYGGVKLLPKKLTLNMNVNSTDMTTSISKKFKAMDSVSNVTEFNTDPFNTWKSAFRECVKLSSQVIDRQVSTETLTRLEVWCTVNEDRQYGKYAIAGAIAGKEFGIVNKNNPEQLKLINDFEWLREQFSKNPV